MRTDKGGMQVHRTAGIAFHNVIENVCSCLWPISNGVPQLLHVPFSKGVVARSSDDHCFIVMGFFSGFLQWIACWLGKLLLTACSVFRGGSAQGYDVRRAAAATRRTPHCLSTQNPHIKGTKNVVLA